MSGLSLSHTCNGGILEMVKLVHVVGTIHDHWHSGGSFQSHSLYVTTQRSNVDSCFQWLLGESCKKITFVGVMRIDNQVGGTAIVIQDCKYGIWSYPF